MADSKRRQNECQKMGLHLSLRLLSGEKLRNEICPNKIIFTKNGGQTKIFEKYNLNFYYWNHLSLLLKFTVFELLIMKFQWNL